MARMPPVVLGRWNGLGDRPAERVARRHIAPEALRSRKDAGMGGLMVTSRRDTSAVGGDTLDPRAAGRAAASPAAQRGCPPGPRRRMIITVVAGAVVIAGGAVIAASCHQPPSLRRALTTSSGIDAADAEARHVARFISGVSALHAAATRPGPWEGVFTADDVNAWLANDLPRNHPRLLPPGWSDPRVGFEPRHAWFGIRRHLGPLRPLVWMRLEASRRSAGEVLLTVADAGIGAIPLPGDSLLAMLRARLVDAGYPVAMARIDGRSRLVLRLPGGDGPAAGGLRPIVRLAALRLDDGELLVAGETAILAPHGE